MFYYEVAIRNQNLDLLTYQSTNAIQIGYEVTVNILKKQVVGIVVKEVEKPSFECKDIVEVSNCFLTPAQIKTAKFVSEYYSCKFAEALSLFSASDYKNIEKIDVKTAIDLSPDQQKALAFVDQPKASLLFGATGSGKSEIYMKLFEKILNDNKTAIFLMPEISLTPQIEKRLKSHFGELVAIWHSKISKKQKQLALENIQSGKVRIVAGARSALFLPMPNLGAIVVDEEHDDSYKSQSKPRYHTRDLAVVYGKNLNIPVVLGSATPAVTSWAKFEHFRLKKQFFDGNKREFIFVENASDEPADQTIELIKETISADKQAIVFVPTRANFKYLLCLDCGANITCPFCEVGMSIYSHKNMIKCHYCNYTAKIPDICPKCSSTNLSANRHGTVEIINLLNNHIDGAKIAQFDRDAVTTDNALRKILKAFDKKEISVLVGTQMLSKGHDYHGVDLAVILGLDHILAMPDFRSSERALSLFLQIAGRAGRKGDSKVVVQTKNRAFFEPFIEDFQLFLDYELQSRKELYPPFTRLLRLEISHKNSQKAKATMDETLHLISGIKELEIVGFGEIFRIKEHYRYQILARSASIQALLTATHLASSPLIDIDIDPISTF